jgi:hypothetical protein
MRNFVEIEPADIDAVQKLLDENKSHPIIMERQQRNANGQPPEITRAALWASHIMCLLTTQNKSGVGSSIDHFLRKQPFPLSWEVCQSAKDVDKLIFDTLSGLHIRRWKFSSDFAQQNFRKLENEGWERVENWMQKLLVQRERSPESDHYQLEREAAQDLQGLLKGIGPKQSRNFWQYLGLTRYEIPLDSRVIRWLNSQIGFYIPVSGLSDERFYCQVLDAIRDLAARADILPCILDAAIFASYEKP